MSYQNKETYCVVICKWFKNHWFQDKIIVPIPWEYSDCSEAEIIEVAVRKFQHIYYRWTRCMPNILYCGDMHVEFSIEY